MKQVLENIDALIVAGELARARKALHDAGRLGAFKTERLGFARLARRLDLPMLALRILHPILMAPRRVQVKDEVRCEYAASLTQVGAYSEAQKMLGPVNEATSPEVSLFKAFNCIAQWDYRRAAEFLSRYVAEPQLSEYQRLIGQANLVAALVYERAPQTRRLLDELLDQVRRTTYKRLLGFLLLRKGELEVASSDWHAAYEALAEALHLAEEESMDRFLIQKWSTIVSLYSNRDRQPLSHYELQRLRAQAVARQEWETVRSIDYHRAKSSGDERLARLVYFGTPHASFREKMLGEFPFLAGETEFLWQGDGEINPRVTELARGLPHGSLRVGQLGHRLLLSLTLDFYRPFKVAELFASLFPDEVFNVDSSPVRVRKAVERARRGLREHGADLRIAGSSGMYSLVLSKGAAVRVSLHQARNEILDAVMAAFPPGRSFTARELTTALGVSESTALRRLRELREAGKLERHGNTYGATYRLKEAA